MDLPRLLLSDLLISPSTADSIAGRMAPATLDDVTAGLTDHEITGLVEVFPLAGWNRPHLGPKPLHVFRLTDQGRTIASTYPKLPAVYPAKLSL